MDAQFIQSDPMQVSKDGPGAFTQTHHSPQWQQLLNYNNKHTIHVLFFLLVVWSFYYYLTGRWIDSGEWWCGLSVVSLSVCHVFTKSNYNRC